MANIGDYVFYRLIYDYLVDKINKFGMDLMGRMMSWAAFFALILVTIYIIVQGYRVMTGRAREPMMELVINLGRIVVIVSAATAMAIGSTNINTFLTTDLDKNIHYLFTGDSGTTTADAIDKNLAYTQLALASIDAVQIVGSDPEMQAEKTRSLFMAGFGSSSPPMAAGAMLLLYQFAMALFIGLGPLFILCLIFDQTKELFRRWLMYGLGTLFSMALLSAVSSMVLELTIRVSVATWGSKLASSFIPGATEGLSSLALQQGGIGLLLTVLIVSVPPMAAMFFQGVLGSALTYSAFTPGGRPGPQGQPAGTWTQIPNHGADTSKVSIPNNSHAFRNTTPSTPQSPEAIPKMDR